MNNKGLSNVVTVLMFILLALVAVGIIWGVVNNLVEKGAEEIDLSSKCLEVKMEVSGSACSGGICNATIKRNAGGEEIGGVKLVFNNDLLGTNYVHDVPGDITPLETKTESNVNTGLGNVTGVEVTPYFKDNVGEEKLCSI